MALSLRLPSDIENMVIAYSAREGVSKSAVIVQSIRHFFERKKPQPTAYEMYLEVMENAKNRPVDERRQIDSETRPHKIAFYQAMQAKQARRQASARAST